MAQPERDRYPSAAPRPLPPVTPIPRQIARALHVTLRVGAGLLFLLHGLQKIFGLFGGQAVPLLSQFGVAGLLELVGGSLIVLGLFTRPVAAVLALEMLVAIAIAHLPRGGSPLENGAELPMLYALIFAFLAANGPGPASVDAARARGAEAAATRPGPSPRS